MGYDSGQNLGTPYPPSASARESAIINAEAKDDRRSPKYYLGIGYRLLIPLS